MALVMSGTALAVEQVRGKKESGESYNFQQIHLLDGLRVFRLRVADEYRGDLPTEGEDVALEVSAYAQGGWLRWNALARVPEPARAAL